MRTLNYTQLVEKLREIKGVAFLGMFAITAQHLNKKDKVTGALNEWFKNIVKHARGSFTSGADYEAAVNRQANREGTEANFTAKPLPRRDDYWLVPGKVIANPRHGFYLRTETTPAQREMGQIKSLGYFSTSGIALDYVTQILPFKGPRKVSARQIEAGLVDTIKVNDYSFASIQWVTIAGETFTMDHGQASHAAAMIEAAEHAPEKVPVC